MNPIEQTLTSLCTSQWLKDALLTAIQRDPADAVHDAQHLAGLLRQRLDHIHRTTTEA
ncbi:hypothetical protein LCGC14_2259780 [marine sediment metagenome]|uniref:Uncharacterized protein n=1 Tax=marine sediment metagenome TaxID=412755 RepID=A0A0F9FV23_9ZZZZ